MATPGRSGLQESRRAGRAILPKWKRIFLTLIPQVLPEKRVWDCPVGRILDKVGQNWPKVAKNGQGWPKLDKAGQNWTAGGQVFQPFCGATNTPRSGKQKTRALFSAGLRGSGSDRALHSENETSKMRPQKPALSKIGQMPINGGGQMALATLPAYGGGAVFWFFRRAW
jgi:hypothetical protein